MVYKSYTKQFRCNRTVCVSSYLASTFRFCMPVHQQLCFVIDGNGSCRIRGVSCEPSIEKITSNALLCGYCLRLGIQLQLPELCFSFSSSKKQACSSAFRILARLRLPKPLQLWRLIKKEKCENRLCHHMSNTRLTRWPAPGFIHPSRNHSSLTLVLRQICIGVDFGS